MLFEAIIGDTFTNSKLSLNFNMASSLVCHVNHNSYKLFIDDKRHVDLILHERLPSKLEYYGIHGQTRNWIALFLHNLTQTNSVDGAFSDEAWVTSDVPQGSVLGPVLFLLYINDISNNISSNMHLSADDSIIYHEIVSWAQTWQMDFNVTKCYMMSITTKTNHSLYLYSMLNQPLSNIHLSKYLRVNIDSNLSWNEHITVTVAKSYKTLGLVKRTLGPSKPSVKEIAYKNLVQHKLEDVAVTWNFHPQSKCYKSAE